MAEITMTIKIITKYSIFNNPLPVNVGQSTQAIYYITTSIQKLCDAIFFYSELVTQDFSIICKEDMRITKVCNMSKDTWNAERNCFVLNGKYRPIYMGWAT